jgi:hypothetical protein
MTTGTRELADHKVGALGYDERRVLVWTGADGEVIE